MLYEMCVLVLGGVSFGTCRNYTLKKDAIENKHIYGKKAVETLRNKFYVEHLKTNKDKPTTRRRTLSILSSVYDPLSFGAPFLLRGKQILERLCEKNLKWDTKLPEDFQTEWKN